MRRAVHRIVDRNLQRFRVPNLPVILIDKVVEGVPDRFDHVVVVQRRLVPLMKVDEQEFQLAFSGGFSSSRPLLPPASPMPASSSG